VRNDHTKNRKNRSEKRGQNKNRPAPKKFLNSEKLCPHYIDGQCEEECKLPNCPCMHDVSKYLELTSKNVLNQDCHTYKTYGKCPRGLSCLFYLNHFDVQTKTNKVNHELWTQMQPIYDSIHGTILDKETQLKLRRRKYDFEAIEKICNNSQKGQKHKVATNVDTLPEQGVDGNVKTSGPFTDGAIAKREIRKIDWNGKLYLSPLTTVGNLPFRRLCVDYGADITCSEMSLATSILQGNPHEFALHRRHPSEKIWGVQLCANNVFIAAKASQVLDDVGIDYDFVDLNMGCPLEPIFRQGAGSGLMCRTNQLHAVVKGMSAALQSRGKSFTVKMRAGVKTDKYIAHNIIPHLKESGVAMVTLHGRTREQRYTKSANWNYISECSKLAEPVPLFGNGDVLSWEDYNQNIATSGVSGVMIGRGALMKPWLFQEIKEQRHIDMTSSQRLELIQRYANYGLDHWGSDSQGVETTRRFLLEWLSFFHRYIPLGILERIPQKINERPPKYFGRDEMETLLASTNSADWVKISEMFLGPVPDNFAFLPKHKANSWS